MSDTIKAVRLDVPDVTLEGFIDVDVARHDLVRGATLAGLQAGVGGVVDCFDIVHPETGAIATVWLHDEGKIMDLPRNEVAEAIATLGGWPGLSFGDWIAGPVVFTGFDPETGETMDLPDEWVSTIVDIAIRVMVLSFAVTIGAMGGDEDEE